MSHEMVKQQWSISSNLVFSYQGSSTARNRICLIEKENSPFWTFYFTIYLPKIYHLLLEIQLNLNDIQTRT